MKRGFVQRSIIPTQSEELCCVGEPKYWILDNWVLNRYSCKQQLSYGSEN